MMNYELSRVVGRRFRKTSQAESDNNADSVPNRCPSRVGSARRPSMFPDINLSSSIGSAQVFYYNDEDTDHADDDDDGDDDDTDDDDDNIQLSSLTFAHVSLGPWGHLWPQAWAG